MEIDPFRIAWPETEPPRKPHVLRPARGMVLLEPLPKESVQNGVFIPWCADGELKSQYVVRAVGKGRVIRTKKKGRWLLKWPEVKVGDKCIANRYAGTPLQINGRLHRLVHDDSIMLVFGMSDSDPRLVSEQGSPRFCAS